MRANRKPLGQKHHLPGSIEVESLAISASTKTRGRQHNGMQRLASRGGRSGATQYPPEREEMIFGQTTNPARDLAGSDGGARDPAYRGQQRSDSPPGACGRRQQFHGRQKQNHANAYDECQRDLDFLPLGHAAFILLLDGGTAPRRGSQVFRLEFQTRYDNKLSHANAHWSQVLASRGKRYLPLPLARSFTGSDRGESDGVALKLWGWRAARCTEYREP